MSFFRQYIAPFAVIVIFLLALFAVSIRIFLPADMAAPAPVDSGDISLVIGTNWNQLGQIKYSDASSVGDS